MRRKTHRIPLFAIDELKARQGGESRVGIGILVGFLFPVVLGQAGALL